MLNIDEFNEIDLTQLVSHGFKDSVCDKSTKQIIETIRSISRSNLLKSGLIDSTLSTTALVNETYIRLLELDGGNTWENKKAFYATLSKIVRNLIIDYVRTKKAARRDKSLEVSDVDISQISALEQDFEFCITMYDAIDRLNEANPRAAQLLEYKFFLGLSVEELSTTLGISKRTIQRDLVWLKDWLKRNVSE